MGATIKVRVKDESLMTKMRGLLWFVRIFQKSKVNVYIDGQKNELVARDEPYSFNVSAGTHTLKLEDPRGKSKKRGRKVTGAVLGAAVGFGMSGSMWGGALGALDGVSFRSSAKKDGSTEIDLAEGSTLAFSCQATKKGDIKIKSE